MILDLNGNLYQMSKKNALEILNFGKEKLTKGIYGVIKDDYAKAMLERYDKVEDLKKAVRKYEMKGFKVLYKE
jgi:mannitol/fructose-specific phosphotransferase system IIA component